MPKFGGHIVIGDGVARALGYSEDKLKGDIGAALRLGAIGPDLTLFLFDPAENNEFVYSALKTGSKLYKQIRGIRDKIDEIENYIGQPATNLADWMSGGFSTSMLEFTGLAVDSFISCLKVIPFSNLTVSVENPFKDLPIETLEKLFGIDLPDWALVPKIDLTTNLDSNKVTSPAYIFRYFGGPYTNDPPFKIAAEVGDYSDWWWMDVLHYRRTTAFARRLLDLAETSEDPVLIAYAIGYFSHVGGDIVGHPYVNSMVGGPFRNHALRHMVIESLLDVSIWSDRGYGEIMSSRLDLKIKLGDKEQTKIATLFNQALMDVFVEPINKDSPIKTKNFKGSAPSIDDIKSAYETMSGYLGFASDIDLKQPIKPAESLGEIWDEIREHLERNIDQINQYYKDLSHSSGWDWLAALIGLVMWTASLVVKLLTLPVAIVARIAAIAPRWFFYLVNTALYDFVSNLRFTMALCGWGYASKKDLDRQISKELLTVHNFGNDGYPFSMTKRFDGFWLSYPGDLRTSDERPNTISGPYHDVHTSADFIDGLKYDDTHDALLKELANPPIGANEVWTYNILGDILTNTNGTSGLFGNAVDFSVKLIRKEFPDGAFDLDGDRGYGSLQWENNPPNTRYIP